MLYTTYVKEQFMYISVLSKLKELIGEHFHPKMFILDSEKEISNS